MMAAFDLDGTLVDSVPDLSYAGDAMLTDLGLPAQGIDAARLFVGSGLERFVKRLLTGDMHAEPEPELLQRGIERYREIYSANLCRNSTVYPGVHEGLEFLRSAGVSLSCITNKSGQFAERLLEEIGLSDYFSLLVSGDTTPQRKPHPLPLQHAAQSLNAPSARSLMVGDSKSDVLAALAAGFKIVCVPYGYNQGEDIRKTRPDAVIESLADLPQLFAVENA